MKLFAGTRNRFLGLSRMRQRAEAVFRMFISGCPPMRGGGRMATASSRDSSLNRESAKLNPTISLTARRNAKRLRSWLPGVVFAKATECRLIENGLDARMQHRVLALFGIFITRGGFDLAAKHRLRRC
ncbi:hypothetical protein [Bradyrhizobium sp.]|uniref:hypothetical protein n=1 Tax=Bradyrhizobium sp. TaxID=376 RepID=UPI001E118C96|nr:hypothetical protein [Bradyrhizobium sp.]MBV8701120.1 hypothetical protein [Bradyrhizobium sp.]MBV8920523.1 hypothetical protein [Bradyrhizobium sp.]MBV9981074.1 hypothetical protein [Bradyrhizobium sp.]